MVAEVRHQQGAAICRLLGDVFGGDHAGRAGPVVDQHRNAPQRGQLLRNDARYHIGAASWRKTHHDPHRSAWQRLGDGGPRRDCEAADGRTGACSRGNELSSSHVVSRSLEMVRGARLAQGWDDSLGSAATCGNVDLLEGGRRNISQAGEQDFLERPASFLALSRRPMFPKLRLHCPP